MGLGRKIAELRKQNNLSQQDFGKIKTALFHYSNSPQKSFKKQHLLVWLSGRAPPW